MKLKPFVLLLFCCVSFYTTAETVFAEYFDIPVNSAEYTDVTGKIHLERNKDVRTNPIPKTYRFTISENDLFDIRTEFDAAGRITGVLRVKAGQNTGDSERVETCTVSLKNGETTLQTFNINIRVATQTLWQTLYDRYSDKTLTTARMYGSTKYSDTQLATLLQTLAANDWRFPDAPSYTTHPADYLATYATGIDDEWQELTNKIGGMGYAYAKSATYGKNGTTVNHLALKNALYRTLLAYTASVPVEGCDVQINGADAGPYLGDGFIMLWEKRLIDNQRPTHQWTMTDALVAPAVQLMPDILADIKAGNDTAQLVYDAFVRYFQLAFSLVRNRLEIDSPDARWGELQDTLYCHGAWTDANLGHRSRTILALPLIWADYNRPITYVPYWYTDFFAENPPFAGFSLSPGWSPHGALMDAARWMTKYKVPSHKYAQSGFHPDGTISHHIGEGTDMAMQAYGFEWLTDVITGFSQYRNTLYRLDDASYQFVVDRLLYTYPIMIYNGYMDFLVCGRGFLTDTKKFATKTYTAAITNLLAAKNTTTLLVNEDSLKNISRQISGLTFQQSGCTAFWVPEFLVHRRGGKDEEPFYASVKIKTTRTLGAEDFSSIRKSWHCGSGVVQLKVEGDEYAQTTLSNNDWHVLPGLTEEWRTDAMPTGASYAAGAGGSDLGGVLSDGQNGMAVFQHAPKETYSSATAFKSYHFVENKVACVGSQIVRKRKGQGENIVTCIDQSALDEILTVSVNGSARQIATSESVSLSLPVNQISWAHIGKKGYVIFPVADLNLLVRTGTKINSTDPTISTDNPNYILALDHGTNPSSTTNSYFYVMLPNVSAAEMPALAQQYGTELLQTRQSAGHAFASVADKVTEFAFFGAGTLTLNGMTVSADQAMQLLLTETDSGWKMAVSNPIPDDAVQQLTFTLSLPLAAGEYGYQIGGIYPQAGETVMVEQAGSGSKITVALPDGRDGVKYNYQETLLNATSVVVEIPKSLSGLTETTIRKTLSVFPNPTTGIVFVDNADSAVSVYNGTGQKIATFAPFQYQIDLSDFPCGFYWLKTNEQVAKVLKM